MNYTDKGDEGKGGGWRSNIVELITTSGTEHQEHIETHIPTGIHLATNGKTRAIRKQALGKGREGGVGIPTWARKVLEISSRNHFALGASHTAIANGIC